MEERDGWKHLNKDTCAYIFNTNELIPQLKFWSILLYD